MDRDGVRRSRELIRSILREIRSTTAWELDEAIADADGQIDAVVDGETTRGELFYTHPAAGARLTVTFPGRERADAAELLLDAPLDTQFQYSDEGFVGKLGAAHRAIAVDYATRYVEPVADPSLPARMRVPVEYERAILVDSLEALGAIAVECDALHADLTTVLSKRLA
jgi:hypothetical protein